MNLKIKNLHVSAENKEILKGINFEFEEGKTYALIGPNGNGKSTLLSTLMGDPNYQITQGEIIVDGEDISEQEADERAKKGLFLGMQYPAEISGVTNLNLMNLALAEVKGQVISPLDSYMAIKENAQKLRLEEEMIEREVNVNFSGGEKKKNEILHMSVLKPSFAMLDEIDSGLDVDSIEAIAKQIVSMKTPKRTFVVISHYKKLYDLINPDYTIVIRDGKISEVGDKSLLDKILLEGFDKNE